MRILVTGGAGFIGCNLAQTSIMTGHQVTLFDNLSRRGSAANLAWLRQSFGDSFTFVQGDVRDYKAVAQVASGQQAIYHLAAQTAVTTSVNDPRTDFEINALGTFNLLEATRQVADNPVFIYASTNKVYGGMEEVDVNELATRYELVGYPDGVSETRSLDFHSPYGCSKGAADQYVRDYARIYGLRTVVFRQSCIYGPRQMGVEDQGWVAWFVIAAITGKPITIYGDGKQVRDLLYVDDLVRAFQLATECVDVTQGQVYNLGGGPANTVAIWCEFGPLLSKIVGKEITPEAFRDWRPGDQPVFVSNIDKAAHDFSWSPEVGPSLGIQRLSEWVKANLEFFV